MCYYHHIRASKRMTGGKLDPALTLAFETKGNKVRVGMAFCSPMDQFSKETGRKLSHQRANGKRKGSFSITPSSNHEATMAKALSHIVEHRLYPQWAEPFVFLELAQFSTKAAHKSYLKAQGIK